MKQTSRQGYLLEAREVSKSFGDTANDGIDFAIRPGEILALLGEKWGWQIHLCENDLWPVKARQWRVFLAVEPLSLSAPSRRAKWALAWYFSIFLFEMLTVAENIELALQGAHDRSNWPS